MIAGRGLGSSLRIKFNGGRVLGQVFSLRSSFVRFFFKSNLKTRIVSGCLECLEHPAIPPLHSGAGGLGIALALWIALTALA